MGLFDTKEVIDALAYELGDPDVDRPEPHQFRYKKGWKPPLNPIQEKAVRSDAIYKIFAGERGSGKTLGALHELLEYVYEEDNALGYIIVKEVGMGTEGGAWHKLLNEIVPVWKKGIGLVITEPKQDAQTKKPYIWIANYHGNWSMIMLASLPLASQVEAKVKGREPDIIFVDEAQTLESDTYFTALLMQLGRRKGRSKPAKIIFACNPEGPSHWLYNRFFIQPIDEVTQTWDSRYGTFHIPISDNEKNLPPNYYRDYVEPAVKNDPIARDRLIKGLWIDRPDGDSLFIGTYSEEFHVRGDENLNQGLLPVKFCPIIVGYDLGAAHSSITFEQIVPTMEKTYKIVFDELDYVGQYMPYAQLVPILMERIIYWEKRLETQFTWEHISDTSAFDQYRAKDGSFDHMDVEKFSKEYLQRKYTEEYGKYERLVIKMKACPKGDGSVETRVRLINDALISQEFLISATCPKARRMFMLLPHDKENRLRPRKKHRWGHNFDSLSYGFFYYYAARNHIPGSTATVKPMIYSMGGR